MELIAKQFLPWRENASGRTIVVQGDALRKSNNDVVTENMSIQFTRLRTYDYGGKTDKIPLDPLGRRISASAAKF